MAKLSNQQFALKPQDLYVLLAMLVDPVKNPTYPQLSARTGLVQSAVHGALKRAAVAGLALFQDRRPTVLKTQLREFVLSGAKYAFPAVHGRLTRGIPTGYAAAPLNSVIAPSADPVPVWPYKNGSVRGMSLSPLYPTVPEAALRDENLYAILALFDAVRSGQARERNMAEKMLTEYFQ